MRLGPLPGQAQGHSVEIGSEKWKRMKVRVEALFFFYTVTVYTAANRDVTKVTAVIP